MAVCTITVTDVDDGVSVAVSSDVMPETDDQVTLAQKTIMFLMDRLKLAEEANGAEDDDTAA